MTQKTMFFDSQTAALLRPWIESEEEITPVEAAESDPDCDAAWAEDRSVAYEPEEIEVFNFNEVKSELGVKFGHDSAQR